MNTPTTMATGIERLDQGHHLNLIGARNTTLTVVSGMAWITVDGAAGDNLLGPGASFVVRSDGSVVVGPLGSALMLEVRRPRAALRAPRSGIGEMLRSLAQRLAAAHAGFHATFCILFAKSRPDVGGGSGLPSL